MQLFVDNLTVIDCSYLHPEHGIEGESWIVDIALDGALNEQSMIMDFGHVKKKLKAAIDDWVDHCLLVPKHAAQLVQLEAEGEGMTLVWQDSKDRRWLHHSPQEALCMMDCEAITAQSVQEYLLSRLPEVADAGVESVQIRLRHEAISTPYYHYSHGLKKHDGNCQRIAHGHRSKLEIWKDETLAEAEIRAWCDAWQHIYLVSEEDITHRDSGMIRSEYHAPQGRFMLEAPADACAVLPVDSTVERIAEHIAATLKAREPAAHWRVKAYEGVQKGAIFSIA